MVRGHRISRQRTRTPKTRAPSDQFARDSDTVTVRVNMTTEPWRTLAPHIASDRMMERLATDSSADGTAYSSAIAYVVVAAWQDVSTEQIAACWECVQTQLDGFLDAIHEGDVSQARFIRAVGCVYLAVLDEHWSSIPLPPNLYEDIVMRAAKALSAGMKMHKMNFIVHVKVSKLITAFEKVMPHLTRASIFDVVSSGDPGEYAGAIGMRSLTHIGVNVCP